MRSLEQSLEYQLPNVVRDFLTTSVPQNGLQGSDMTATTFQAQLQEIGDIYGNREVIVQRTMERLTGVPAQVRDSVINDWYADIKMQPSDPDTTTTIDTLLDERILRQVDRAGVWPRLSLELQQRLDKSRR